MSSFTHYFVSLWVHSFTQFFELILLRIFCSVVLCSCCKKACVEVKCPYSIRNQSVLEAWNETSFLEKAYGKIQLKRNHKYYTQIIGQLAMTRNVNSVILLSGLQLAHLLLKS